MRSFAWGALAILAATGVALVGARPEPAWSAPWSGAGHGKSKKAAGPVIPKQGVWRLAAGATQDVFNNEGKAAVDVVAYVCVDIKPIGQPVVDVEIIGRPAIEAASGCQNVFLQVNPGERITLVNPGADSISGAYKMSEQGGKQS